MRDALKVGDDITTIGGIVGDVVSISGREGAERSSSRPSARTVFRMELEEWSVSTNNTATAAARKAAIESGKSGRRAEKGEEKQVKLALTRKLQSVLRVSFLFGCYVKSLCPPCWAVPGGRGGGQTVPVAVEDGGCRSGGPGSVFGLRVRRCRDGDAVRGGWRRCR